MSIEPPAPLNITTIFDVLTVIGLVLVFLSGFVASLAGMYLVVRKVRKEIGLWQRHRRYHPARPVKQLHFQDYESTVQSQQIDPEP